jgi:hypothetical protein
VCGGVLAGCGTPECGAGADSATGAVRILLEAARDKDAARACSVANVRSESAVGAGLPALSRLASGAGSVDRLAIAEDQAARMGAEAKVDVSAGGAVLRRFSVLQSGNRFTVVVDENVQGSHGASASPAAP